MNMLGSAFVSVIIINYNTYNFTTACIESVLKFTKEVRFEIILVENGTGQFSTDSFPGEQRVKVVVSPENLGFAGGNNLGIAHASGNYILLLNSDTILKDDAVSKCVAFLANRPDVGALTPRLVYPDGRVQSVAQRFPSAWRGLAELLRLQKLLPRKKAGKLLLGPFFDHSETVEADWIWGAFFLMPKKVIDQMPGGKLDDEFFMYWEDVQWCKDIKKLGFKIVFFAGAEVIHIHEGSKGKKNEMMAQNGRRFMQRNYSRAEQFLISTINKLL